MEASAARLESEVGHLRSNVTELTVEVRRLHNRLDRTGIQLRAKIDKVGGGDNKFDGFNKQSDRLDKIFDELQASIVSSTIWTITVAVALGVAMWLALARGFGWI